MFNQIVDQIFGQNFEQMFDYYSFLSDGRKEGRGILGKNTSYFSSTVVFYSCFGFSEQGHWEHLFFETMLFDYYRTT